MGGRGASSGTSKRGKKYGSEYRTLLKTGNIKFVIKTSDESEELLETMTKGRVYVTVRNDGQLKSIIYFDERNKRRKSIHLDHNHKKMRPHVAHGYFDNEQDVKAGIKKKATHLTPEEKRMVDFVVKEWENKKANWS